MKDNALLQVLAPAVDISLPTGRDANNGLVYSNFKLVYDFNAICAVKAATGRSLLNGNVWNDVENDPELVSAMLWAGLRAHHPDLKVEQVRAMMFPLSVGELLVKMMEAWTASSPKPKDAPEADPKREPETEPVPVQ